jgi:hypothetical protein
VLSLDNDLPPWRAGIDERKRRQMEEWVNRKLDEITKLSGDEWLWFWSLENLEDVAVQAAEECDLEPLRRQFPKHARFINPPKLKRGEHFKDATEVWLQRALEDVPRIRAIWKKHYGKTNRPRGELTAEEIAAERWNLLPDEVRKRRISRALGKARPR